MAARTRFGLTWWGQRWIAALEALGAAYVNRLPRGRTYARRGAVQDLQVGAGRVVASVQGSRPSPYRVTVSLPAFDDDQWEAIIAALAGQLRHAAALLDGRMPEDVDEVLVGCGLSLFPHAGELRTACSCPDHANPCKHVAAVHYILAQTFDADPFLLPMLRGCDRAALLAGLRAARTGETTAARKKANGAGGSLPMASLSADRLFTAGDDLASIAIRPRPPEDPGAVLRRLGPLPASVRSTGTDAPERALEEQVRSAAERAWRLLTDGNDSASDPLLAALRDRGSATSQQLSGDLGWPVPAVRAGLRALVESGAVYRTGHARGIRYHA